MRAALTSAALLAAAPVVLPAPPGDAASPARTNGQIAYDRADPRSPDDTFIYTTNPDGSRARRLMPRHTCCPSWSHDGRTLAIPASLPGDRLTTATVGADGRSYKQLPIEDPTLSVACAGGAGRPTTPGWRAKAGTTRASHERHLYPLLLRRSSTKRLTASPGGGDLPGSYSPDGRHIVFARYKEETSIGLFVINTDGSRQHRITPHGIIMQGETLATGRRRGTTSSSRERPRQPDAVRSGSSAQTEATCAT